MRLYYPIEVDLYKPYPLPIMEAQQNNIGRGAMVTLKANGAILQPTNEGLTFWARKPDGTVSFLAATLTGSNIQMDFTNQMLALSGIVQVEIRLTSGSGESETDISTPIFAVRVNPSNINDSAIESQNEFTALQVAIGEVRNALAEIDELRKTGLKGEPGDAATIEVGTVTASAPGSSPQVTNSGTAQAAVLDFILPRGESGPAGPGADVVADAYSETTDYASGDYCINNNTLYKFTGEKPAGAWDESVVEATLVGEELSALNTNTEILTGTLGEQNVTTYFSFPDGYNSTNCMIVSMMVYVNPNYIGNAINFNWTYVSLESSRIAIISRDSSVVGKTFKLLLHKTK